MITIKDFAEQIKKEHGKAFQPRTIINRCEELGIKVSSYQNNRSGRNPLAISESDAVLVWEHLQKQVRVNKEVGHELLNKVLSKINMTETARRTGYSLSEIYRLHIDERKFKYEHYYKLKQLLNELEKQGNETEDGTL